MGNDAGGFARSGGQGKYARLERERRFLLRELPSPLGPGWHIEDRYVIGTRLRLRRMADEGGSVGYKFCQKVRPDEREPSTVAITNIYLSRDEYERLRQLPATSLSKTRRSWDLNGYSFAVDEFHGALAGLLLAEVELPESRAGDSLPPSPLLGLEVTYDERFTGGYLAAADAAQVKELLAVAARP